MTKLEMLKTIDAARAKFHALAVAVRMVKDGHGTLQLDRLLQIVDEGNQLCGQTLNASSEYRLLYDEIHPPVKR